MAYLMSVILLIGSLLVPTTVRASDAPGCEGLEQFRSDLFPIGEQWADELQQIGVGGPDWSPATLSSDDWTDYAKISLSVNRELKAIDAPDWLQDWLDVRIDSTALQEQAGKAAADAGFLAIAGFLEEFDKLDQRDVDTERAATAQCPDFAQFAYDWDALDGEVDGTPVAGH